MKRMQKNVFTSRYRFALLAVLIVVPMTGIGQDLSLEETVEELQMKVDHLSSRSDGTWPETLLPCLRALSRCSG